MMIPGELPSASDSSAPATAPARRAMIDSQLRPSGVNQAWVLEAMAAVPRENFVPPAMRDAAYIDRAIALGDGRFLAPPLVHARMLAEAAPTTGDTALLVGDGDGYLATLLRPLVGRLDTITPAELARGASIAGGLTLIVVDGAIEALPAALVNALVDGGRVVTGLVTRGVTRLATGRCTAGAGPVPASVPASVALLPLADLGIPVLTELAVARRWSF